MQTIQQLLNTSFSNYGEATAVLNGINHFTYRELEALTNPLSGRFSFIRPGTKVAVCTGSRFNMLVYVIGIIRAKGIFVPLDTGLPDERLRYIIHKTDCGLVLTDSDAAQRAVLLAGSEVQVVVPGEESRLSPAVSSVPEYSAHDDLYVYFTSGSTGQPKGVLGCNRGLTEFVQWQIGEFGITPGMRFSQLINPGFDAWLRDVFVPLCSGGICVLPEDAAVLADSNALSAWIENSRVNAVHCVPSLFRLFNSRKLTSSSFPELKYVFLSGEKIIPSELNNWYNAAGARVQLVNFYGATETTMIKFFYRIQPSDTLRQSIPAGKPISGTTLYLLDRQMKPAGLRMTGEIYVHSTGTSKGYYNEPALTGNVFIPSPFHDKDILYKTGDQGMLDEDGNLILRGRIDRQLKIQGVRVEPEEVEACLANAAGVQQAVVAPGGSDAASQVLTAYVVCSNGTAEAYLREYLLQRLPAPMVPGRFVFTDAIPLKPNGKIDFAALASLSAAAAFEKPSTAAEIELAALWADLLNRDSAAIGRFSGFFEMGGHSLSATVLAAQIEKKWNVVFPVRQVFAAPSLSSMASAVLSAEKKQVQQIAPAPVQEYYVLAPAQERLYFLQQYDTASTAYNITTLMTVRGNLDTERFNSVLHELSKRHAALRTSYITVDGQPYQTVAASVVLETQVLDVPAGEQEAAVEGFIQPFDMSKAPLVRAGLIRSAGQDPVLVFDVHHSVCDGTSLGIIVKEAVQLYNGHKPGADPVQFVDYAVWIAGDESRRKPEVQRRYWLEQLSGELPMLQLPCDFERPARMVLSGRSYRFMVPDSLFAGLKKAALAEGTTLYNVLLAGYAVLLYRLSGQQEIMIGTIAAGRKHPDLLDTVGMFANTLALRLQINPGDSFHQLISNAKKITEAAIDNQEYPFDEIVRELVKTRDASRNPVFDVMFNLQNLDIPEIRTSDVSFTRFDAEKNISKFDLTLRGIEENGHFEFTFEYNTRLFRHDTIERYADYLLRLYASFVEQPEAEAAAVRMMSDAELTAEYALWEADKSTVAASKTIIELFEACALRSPRKVAITGEGSQLTYSSLNSGAEVVAGNLEQAGVRAGDVVALVMKHSPELIMSILGVLKCGAVFMPVEPSCPVSRRQYMLESAGVKAVVTDDDAAAEAEYGSVRLLRVSAVTVPSGVQRTKPVFSTASTAYIIFTSGTSGRPKGVKISNGALVNYALFGAERYLRGENDVFAFFTPVSFDLTLTSIFVPLISGNSIRIYKPGRNEALTLSSIITDDTVTVIKLTPSHLRLLDQPGDFTSGIHTIIAGGESLPYELTLNIYRKFRGRVAIINEYGPTEATVGCMHHEFSPADLHDTVPIGKPVPGNSIYLLNTALQPVPKGTAGEIYIGGLQLAEGYTGDEELTAAKFISNPWKPGEKLYRTGDLAKRLPGGGLIYLGRIDEQVKFRGYRIEPGEIENCLMKYEDITAAVAAPVYTADGGSALVAWYTAARDYDSSLLRQQLSASLPPFMIPSHFVRISSIPLTSNGKVNKAALPLPATQVQQAAAATAPRHSEVPAKLRKIWSAVLMVPEADITEKSDFFTLGGHSLTAINLVSKVQKETGVLVSIGDVFEATSFESQVKLIEQLMGVDDAAAAVPLSGPVKAAPAASYPLSSVQRRLYFLYQLSPDAVTYNIPFFYQLRGHVDINRIEDVFRQIVSRHENFRTVFRMQFGEPRQFVLDNADFRLEMYDDISTAEAIRSFVRPFNMETGPLFRVALLREQGVPVFLMMDIHHIVSDEITFEKLMKEFLALYTGKSLPEPLLQYKDFAVWQQGDAAYLENITGQKEFWLNLLEGELPLINLPADFIRPAVKSYAGDIVSCTVESSLLNQLKRIAADNDVTLYMLLLAAYHVLISKLCNTEDVITGTITAGRRQQELQEIMGAFVNTVVLRTKPAGETRFADYLRAVKQTTVAVFENQDYPYEDLLENLKVERDVSRNPLFEIMFNMHPLEHRQIQVDGLTAVPWNESTGTTKFDLNLQVNQLEGELQLHFYYSTALFRRQTVSQWVDCYINLLKELTAATAVRIGDMNLLDATVAEQVINGFNRTEKPFSNDQLMHVLFEQQAAIQPGHTAVMAEGGMQLTYAELNAHANGLAAKLIEAGAGEGKFIAITLDRHVYTIVAVLAVLKSGAAYVPLEPYLPAQRISAILDSLNITTVLTDVACTAKVMECCEAVPGVKHIFCLDGDTQAEAVTGHGELFIPGKYDNPGRRASAGSLAYVIFTSGSTGTPKGVAVTHRPVINLIEWVNNTYNIGSHSKVLFTTSLAFDLSVYDVFGLLAAGGCIRIASRSELLEPAKLISILAEEEITFWDSAPAALQQLVPYFERLRGTAAKTDLFFLSGDWIPLDMPKNIRQVLPNARVVGLGGATEATVWSNYFNIDQVDPQWRSIPYGKPIQNARYYILDSYKKPCPPGVKGDLYIGGGCLASCYINDAELTARKFVADPFVSGGTMYYTGDKARWFDDGNIEFLGREDAQVKIRGYRVELGEIEHHLLKCPGINSAKVAARRSASGQLYLCAYCIADTEPDEQELAALLGQHLPEYMVPSFFVRVSSFPVTANGKLDIKALPDPVLTAVQSGGSLPENELEAAIKNIWAGVLGIPADTISTDADFFRAGGNSLNAGNMLAQVLKQLNTAVPLISFFQKPTIKGIASFIEKSAATAWTPIKASTPKAEYRLSPAQHRLFTMQFLNPELVAYNILVAFRLEGKPDIQAIETAFARVISRHESLRTSFELGAAAPVQRIHNDAAIKVEQFIAAEEDADACILAFKRPFTLSEPPLLRAGLITVSPEKHILVMDIHHIIADGVTMDILVKDFVKYYTTEPERAAELQYRDYVEWYYEYGQQDVEKQRSFWLKQFEDGIPELYLPGFEKRNGLPGYEGGLIRFSFSNEITPLMNRLEMEEAATAYMVLFSILNVFISRLSGQEDIVIGTPVAGRRHPDLRDIAGLFVNVLALRSYPAPHKTFRELLREVRLHVLSAFENQEYQFDDLVNELVAERDWSRNPLFDVYFFMDNIGITPLEIPGVRTEVYPEQKQTTQYDLMVGMALENGIISGTFSYRTGLFAHSVMESWCAQFLSLAEQLLRNPDIPVSDAVSGTGNFAGQTKLSQADVLE